MDKTHIIVLPGGGYAEYSSHEGDPVATWLRDCGVSASAFYYPLHQRHPVPLDALQSEISHRRAAGASRIGLMGFSAGGHLAGLAALASGATPQQMVQFAILGYSITSMQTETYRPSRLILLGADATPELRRATSLDALVSPRRRRSSSGTQQRTPTCRPNTPTDWRHRSLATMSRTPYTCLPTAHTASASPRERARPRSGPAWPGGGSASTSEARHHPGMEWLTRVDAGPQAIQLSGLNRHADAAAGYPVASARCLVWSTYQRLQSGSVMAMTAVRRSTPTAHRTIA